MKKLGAVTLAIICIGLITYFLAKPGYEILTKKQPAENSTNNNSTFENLELNFDNFDNFYTDEQVKVKDESQIPYEYNIVIQDFPLNAEPTNESFKLEGFYQVDVADANESLLEGAKTDLVGGTIEELEVDGKPAVAGKYLGNPEQYLVLFIYNNKLFRITVLNSNNENIETTKRLLATFDFNDNKNFDPVDPENPGQTQSILEPQILQENQDNIVDEEPVEEESSTEDIPEAQ